MSINVMAFAVRKSAKAFRQFLFLALIHGATSMLGGLFLFLVLAPQAKAADPISYESFAALVVSKQPSAAEKRTADSASAVSDRLPDTLERPSIRRYSAADAAAEFNAKVQHVTGLSFSVATPLSSH